MPTSLRNMRDLLLPGLRQVSLRLSEIERARAVLMPQLTSISSDIGTAFDILVSYDRDALDLVIGSHGTERLVKNFLTRHEIENDAYLHDFYARVVRCVDGYSPAPVTDHSAFSLGELEAATDYIEANK